MSYEEAILFLYSLRRFGLKLGLENTIKLATLAGSPQSRLRFVHVAGTNGKGSTCAMLEGIYRAAGLRVGLFTSPHLVSFRERIQINRQLISEADVVQLVEAMQCLMDPFVAGLEAWFQPADSPGIPAGSSSSGDPITTTSSTPARGAKAMHPTFFEVVTVMALRYFAEQRCDLVIWETGMGGRLDATNIVTPLASVITNVQFDHQDWLGHTRAQIAAEKAGIIKPGVPVITATDAPEALEVIVNTARERNAPVTIVASHKPMPGRFRRKNFYQHVPDRSRTASGALWGGSVDKIALPLLGEYQRINALLAMATVQALQDKIPASEEAVRIGLETVQWPGRLQLVQTACGRIILLDGAHNVSSAEALRAALCSENVRALISKHRPGTETNPSRSDAGTTLILGVLADKDWPRMCAILAPLAGRVLVTAVSSERTAAPEALCAACLKANPNAETRACSSLAEALNHSANDPLVIIAGSLYLVGEAMELLGLSPAIAGNERGLNEWTLTK